MKNLILGGQNIITGKGSLKSLENIKATRVFIVTGGGSMIANGTIANIETMMKNNNYCVIMAGGIGSRFWPFSRNSQPKQFLDFFGTGRSLLQQTFDACPTILGAER